MPNKQFILDDGLTVTVYKRKASRSLRLSIAPGGQVRVSIPTWAPYQAGVRFAASRQDWIRSQQSTVQPLVNGQAIGKAHHLQFIATPAVSRPTGRVGANSVVVRYPPTLAPTSPTVQAAAQEACIRALRAQAEQLLPQRLAHLATQHGFSYTSVAIKRLRGRWGSCDQHRHIVLNLFLMQLPWELIDYVLLHELTHTVALGHGAEFWQRLTVAAADAKQRRKNIRQYQPVLAGYGIIKTP